MLAGSRRQGMRNHKRLSSTWAGRSLACWGALGSRAACGSAQEEAKPGMASGGSATVGGMGMCSCTDL